jgi:hypothetical protein
MQEMGFGVPEWNGLSCIPKRKFHWVFSIPGISGSSGLPCKVGARPSINFREIEIQHVNEIIYFPGKPEWKQLQLTLFDIEENETGATHPIMQWIEAAYDPRGGDWFPSFNNAFRKQTGTLTMLDGCGEPGEMWSFDGLWPQTADFGELDMSNYDIATCEVTLRYDRAY